MKYLNVKFTVYTFRFVQGRPKLDPVAKMSGIAGKPELVAAIDFGTTHCSVAYLLRPDLADIPREEVEPNVLKLDSAGRKRVPICILFDPNGNKIAFGQEARHRFAALKSELRPRHYYFEHVKKHLQHEKVISKIFLGMT